MFVNHIHIKPAEIMANGTVDHFLKIADKLGFEGGVCFAPFSFEFDMIAGRSDCPNIWLANAIKNHETLIGYGTLNPQKDPVDQVKQIADLGFCGIKLHAPVQEFDIFGSWARAAYEAMQEYRLIADFHLGVHGYRLKHYNPLLCDEISYHYPELRMVFEHVGGWHYYRQVLAVISNRLPGKLYAGITSIFDRGDQRPWYLGAEGLEECKWQIGSELLIYGLDFPFNQLPQIKRDLEVIRSLGWSNDEVQNLTGGNLRRLLEHKTAS